MTGADRAIRRCLFWGNFGLNCSFLVPFIISTAAVTVPVNCSYLSPCSLSFVTPLLLSNPPAEGGKSEAVSKWLTTLWWLENLSGTTKLGSSIPQSQQSLGKYSMISPRMSSLINKIGMCSDDVLYLNSLILLFSNIISFLDDVNLVM